MRTHSERRIAGGVAGVAWVGLLLLLADQARRLGGDVPAALWANGRFFTDLSNLLIAMSFTAAAVNPRLPRRLLGMPLASTLMASAVYYGLLGGASALGTNGMGDVIAHAVTPLLVTVWWLVARSAPAFRYRDIGLWIGFPLAYCAYAVTRGLIDGRYPYFFLDVARLGWEVAGYVLAIMALFCAIAALVVAVDRKLRPAG